jgi:diguanylate cyclase (GGDEF)-like protein
VSGENIVQVEAVRRDIGQATEHPLHGGRAAGFFSRSLASISATSSVVRSLVAVLLVCLIGALDWATGSEVSFSVFYLIPVAFAGGLISRRAGRIMALVSATVWGYLEATTGRPYSAEWIPIWNSMVRLTFFLLVNELIDRVRLAHSREQALSRTDAVTGIANGRVFYEHAQRVIARSRRDGRPFTLVYADLDRFKQVNDDFGHSEGDRLLGEVAALIENGVRTTDVVARLGGDEFGILMPDAGEAEVRVSVERIAASLVAVVGDRWSVGATFGAVTFREPPEDADGAVRLADALMYKGKAAGRGLVMQATWPGSGDAEGAKLPGADLKLAEE